MFKIILNQRAKYAPLFLITACLAACEPTDTKVTEPPVTQPPITTPVLTSDGFPAPVLSSTIPTEVNIPTGIESPAEMQPYFDVFSWQSFIALNWPVDSTWPTDPTRRGDPQAPNAPATLQSAAQGTITVWGSYKEAFELFSQNGARPSAWDSNDDPAGICEDVGIGQKKMVMINKGGTILDEIDEAFSFPLIDQNKNYAWAEVRYNQWQYDFIRGDSSDPTTELYKRVNLTNAQDASSNGAIQMPASSGTNMGSMMLKATWRQMTDVDELDRYYVIDAYLYNTETKECDQQSMGLVGLHIAQKLVDAPQWIWSSFEQVDNIERGPGASPTTPISFNNGTDSPATVNGFANRPTQKAPPLQPISERVPVQVTRANPIFTTPAEHSTTALNQSYQAALAGTVWANYQLVITQWPTDGSAFKIQDNGGIYPKDSGDPFPTDGAVNAVMETFFQTQEVAIGAGGNSCISCHYGAAESDYSWVLQNRANDTPVPQ